MKYLLVTAVLSMWTLSAGAEVNDPLAEYRWANRVLIAFANDALNPHAHSLERALVAARCELVDRDMVTGWILLKGNSRLGEVTVSNEIDGLLRSGLGIQPGEFAVLLIGKDGGVKARYDSVPELSDIFALVDGMPMRRAELRTRASACAG